MMQNEHNSLFYNRNNVKTTQITKIAKGKKSLNKVTK